MSEMGSRPPASFPPPAPREALLVEVTTSDWKRRAARVGRVAGRAVVIFRRVRRKLYEFDPQQAAGDAAQRLRHEATTRSGEWRHTARMRGAELRDRAIAGYERARARAEQVGRDYPAHIVFAAAAAGLALGAGLRIWRSRRAA